MKYSLETLANYINMDNIPKSWENCYIKSLETYPYMDWLNIKFIQDAINFYNLVDEKDYIEKIYNAIIQINNDKKLKIIANLFHYILFEDNTNQISDIWSWGHNVNMFNVMGNNLLPLIVLLSGYKLHDKNMTDNNFDEEQKRASKHGVYWACLKDKNNLGLCGIRFSQMVWGAYFINIKLITISSLQYEYFVPDEDFKIKVSKLNKEFYDNKITFNNNSFFKVHIPQKTDFSPNSVLNSIKTAYSKLKQYFPQINYDKIYFFCESWLLSPDLDKFLNRNSNIMFFKSLFDVLPDYNQGRGYFKFLFNQIDIVDDFDKMPETTSLQRNVKDYLLKGNCLCDGYGFIKNEVIKNLTNN